MALLTAVPCTRSRKKIMTFDVESGEKKMKVSADTDPTQYNSRRRIFTTR